MPQHASYNILPVYSSGSFLRFNVHIIMVDINFWYLDLEMVGQEPNWLSKCSQARTPRRLEEVGRWRTLVY